MPIDIETLAQQIVNSDNFESEFAKVASDLDEQHKVTLAREVNKLNFLKNLANANLNENIEFPVIDDIPQLSKIASDNNDSTKNITKTASYNKGKEFEKKAHVTADMFVFKEDNVVRHKNKPKHEYTYNITKTAEEKFNEELEVEQVKLELTKIAEEKSIIGKAEICKTYLIEKLANIVDNESEMRSVLRLIIDNGGEKYIDDVLNSGNMSSEYIMKVASEVIDFNTHKEVLQILHDLNELDEAIEKKATGSISNLISKTIKLSGKAAKGVVNVGK